MAAPSEFHQTMEYNEQLQQCQQAEQRAGPKLWPEKQHSALPAEAQGFQRSNMPAIASKELNPKIRSCLTRLERMKKELSDIRDKHMAQIDASLDMDTSDHDNAKNGAAVVCQTATGSAPSPAPAAQQQMSKNIGEGAPKANKGMGPTQTKSSLKRIEENKDFYSLNKEDQLRKTIWKRGVSARDMREYLEDELEQESACASLIWAVMMLTFFCVGAFQHLRLEQVHAEDHAVTFDIVENANFAFTGSQPFENGRMGHKTINDVNSIADFWSWMNLGLVPIFFPVEGVWDVSESRTNTGAICQQFNEALIGYGGYNTSFLVDVNDASRIHGNIITTPGGTCPEGPDQPTWPEGFLANRDEKGAHTYLYYHSIVAGARIRQEYTPATAACEGEDTWRGYLYTGKCVPNDYTLEPEPGQALFSNEHLIDSSRTRFLLSHMEQPELRQVLRMMENEVWLSPHTAKVEIMFATFNPHLNALTVVFVNFFLNRAGHIHKVLEPITILISPYETWQNYLWDILWLLLVVKLAFDEMIDIYGNVKEDGVIHGVWKYVGIGNCIDWINIVYSIIICIMWLSHLSNISTLTSKLLTADTDMVGSWPTEQERNDFFDTLTKVVQLQFYFRRVLAFYPLVVVSKFLKVFSYSPRLAMMTDTLYQASTDIIHFTVIFFCVFVIYAISGMLLFGQELLEFANFYRSIDETFKVVMGDFDWELLRRVGRAEALLWFGTFMVMVNLIMLNMLLAIVMDVYSGVKSALPEDADTLWSQLFEVYTRKRDVWWLGTRVSLKRVKLALDLPDDNEEAQAWKLKQKFIVKQPESEAVFHLERKDISRPVDLDTDGIQLCSSGLRIGRVQEDGCQIVGGQAIGEKDLELDPAYEGFEVTAVDERPVSHDDQSNFHAHTKDKDTFSFRVRGEGFEDDDVMVGLVDVLKNRGVEIRKEQARILLMQCVKHHETGDIENATISETNNKIAQIGESLIQLRKFVGKNSRLASEEYDVRHPGMVSKAAPEEI